MDEACNDLLARARLAMNEDRRLIARELFGLRTQVPKGGRVADQATIAGHARTGTRPQLEGVIDQLTQHLEFDRLGDEVERAQLERTNRRVYAAKGGDHRHRQARKMLLNVLDQIEPIAVRQAHVGQAQTIALALEAGTCLRH